MRTDAQLVVRLSHAVDIPGDVLGSSLGGPAVDPAGPGDLAGLHAAFDVGRVDQSVRGEAVVDLSSWS